MSEIKVNSIKGVGASSAAITVNNTDGTCTANITNNLSNRNLIINGAMQVSQRATTNNTTGASSTYKTLDRYMLQIQSGTITESQQDLATTDTPYTLGFRKYMRLTNQSGVGAGAAQYVQIDHRIEAQNVAQSGWNYTSTSSFITLSFWVRASVTQAYYGRVMTNDGTERHYPYKICDSGGTTLTADTWTKITVTVPGNSGLTFNNDNGIGLILSFVPYYGTTYTSANASLNAWNTSGSGYDYFPDNTTTWATTTNATFDITGVQLEVGSVATDFEHRSYGDELARCQRYYYRWTGGASSKYLWIGQAYSSSACFGIIRTLPVTMRAIPTASASGTFTPFGDDGSQLGHSAFTSTNIDNNTLNDLATTGWSGGSGISGGDAVVVVASSGSDYIDASAEL
jgi:hypothetical protein